jgi:hypothetical protein
LSRARISSAILIPHTSFDSKQAKNFLKFSDFLLKIFEHRDKRSMSENKKSPGIRRQVNRCIMNYGNVGSLGNRSIGQR